MNTDKIEKLFEAIGGIKDRLVDEASEHRFVKKIPWRRWVALAAAFALVVGLGSFGLSRLRMGSSAPEVAAPTAPEPQAPAEPASPPGTSSGSDTDGIRYLSYAGPVLSLDALGSAEGITAERHTDFDFSLYLTERSTDYGTNRAFITDEYILTNHTEQDITLTLVYPFAASMFDRADTVPVISADSAPVSAQLHAGVYRGGFRGTNEGESYNLDGVGTWEEYSSLLESGAYPAPELPEPEMPVIVYELNAPQPAEELPLSTDLTLNYSVDYGSAELLSFGFNAGSSDPDKGVGSRRANVGRAWGDSAWLILTEGDLTEYEAVCSEQGVDFTLERYETTLGEVLRDIAAQFRPNFSGWYEDEMVFDLVSDEEYMAAVLDVLYNYGKLSENPVQRYSEFAGGRMDELFSDVISMQRIMYLSFEVTVPAQGSSVVSAHMAKEASFDYAGTGAGDPNANGYDLLCPAGTALSFTRQTATLSNYEGLEILGQNFGFDLDSGVTSVELDGAQEHYWMSVRRRDGA